MVETDKLLKWTISELKTLEINVDILIENVSARYKNDPEIENVISSIRSSFDDIRFELITNRSWKLHQAGLIQLGYNKSNKK